MDPGEETSGEKDGGSGPPHEHPVALFDSVGFLCAFFELAGVMLVVRIPETRDELAPAAKGEICKWLDS